MARRRVIYAAVLIAAFLYWIRCDSYAAFTVFLAVIVFPLLSVLLALLARKKVSVEADFPEYMEKAEHMSIRLLVRNRAVVPVARVEVRISFQNSLTLESGQTVLLLSAGARSEEYYDVELQPVYTGTLTFTTPETWCWDCFGLVRFRERSDMKQETKIFPQEEVLDHLMEEQYGRSDDSERYSLLFQGNDVSEIFGTHEYRPGDEIRRINWKQSSKFQELIVREFSLPLNPMITILLELKKVDPAHQDQLNDLALTLSRSMIEQGLIHNIAWYDSGREEFCFLEVADLESFEIVRMRLMESWGYEHDDAALNWYLQHLASYPAGAVYYFAPEPDDYRMRTVTDREFISVKGEQDMIEAGA